MTRQAVRGPTSDVDTHSPPETAEEGATAARDPKVPSRFEYAFHAAIVAIVIVMVRIHFPTDPEAVQDARFCLALALIWFLIGLVRGRPPVRGTWVGWTIRTLWWLPVGAGLVIPGLLSGASLVMVVPYWAAFVIGAALPLTWLLGLWLARRELLPHGAARIYITVSGFLLLLSHPVLLHLAWGPPPASTCRRAAEHEHVQRLTGKSFVENRSQPYELEWIPERQMLVGTMKMAGNAKLPYWDDPSANLLVFFDMSDPSSPKRRVHRLNERIMPEYMAVHPDNDRLAVTLLGYGKHGVLQLDISDIDAIQPSQRRIWDRALNGMTPVPDSELLAIFEAPSPVVEIVGWDDLETRRRYVPGASRSFNAMFTADVAGAPERGKAYATLLDGPVIELDILRPDVVEGEIEERLAEVPYEGGCLATDSEHGLVAKTNLFREAVTILDMDTLDIREIVPAPAESRAVVLDPERRLLIVGGWLEGQVRIFSYDGWKELVRPLPGVPYMRDMAYDAERSHLYVASKCGIYRIDVEGYLADNAGDA